MHLIVEVFQYKSYQKQHVLTSRRLLLLKRGALFIPLGRNQITLHFEEFLKYECELYLKEPLTPSQHKIIVACCTLNHRLTTETGQCTIIPISRDTILCHFCSYNGIENEAHFVLECPLYNRIRNKFPSLFENAVPRSLKSSFQLDQQVNISLALSHRGHRTSPLSRINWFETILMYFQSHQPFRLPGLSNQFHFVSFILRSS